MLTLLVSTAGLWDYSVVLSCDMLPSYCYVRTLNVASYTVLTCCFLSWYSLPCYSLLELPLLIYVMFQALLCYALSWQPGLLRWQACQVMSRNFYHTITVTMLLIQPAIPPGFLLYIQPLYHVSSPTTSYSIPPNFLICNSLQYSTMFPLLQTAYPPSFLPCNQILYHVSSSNKLLHRISLYKKLLYNVPLL